MDLAFVGRSCRLRNVEESHQQVADADWDRAKIEGSGPGLGLGEPKVRLSSVLCCGRTIDWCPVA